MSDDLEFIVDIATALGEGVGALVGSAGELLLEIGKGIGYCGRGLVEFCAEPRIEFSNIFSLPDFGNLFDNLSSTFSSFLSNIEIPRV